MNILKNEIGIRGTAFKWFESYITGRCQKVKIGETESIEIVIEFGVPQGSVLGPILFNIYIRSLYATVAKLKFAIHGYADDHQVYKSFNKIHEYSVITTDVPECLRQIQAWMYHHFLLNNADKTEIIIFGSPAVLKELSLKGVFLENESICVRFKPVVKNLGFRLESNLSMAAQANYLKNACFLKLRNISRMKSFLSIDQTKLLAQAIVISSLDYCNSLYYGCPQSVMSQLQTIQNRACRIVCGLKKKDSVDEKLVSLHWLKVVERIKFKIILLTFKGLNGLAPIYISELFQFNQLEDSRAPTLHTPTNMMKCDRAFQVSASILWNELPNSIRELKSINVFKSKLKTHLFRISHNI